MGELIYHYVKDFSVLQEFLKEDAQIFATHRLFFVDTKEGEEASRFLIDTLKSEPWFKEITADLRQKILSEAGNSGIYIFSLSSAEDDKSLWKEHSSSKGFAIGFDKELLENALQGEYVYSSDDLVINEILNCCFVAAGNCCYSPDSKLKSDDHDKERFPEWLIRYLKWFFYKEPRWESEQEYRLFLYFPPNESLRFEQMIGDKPRISIPMKFGVKLNSLIKRIFIAPSCDITKKRQMHLLQQQIYKMSITDIDLRYSKHDNNIWEKE